MINPKNPSGGEQVQAALDEDHVDVVVALLGRLVAPLVEVTLLGRPTD